MVEEVSIADLFKYKEKVNLIKSNGKIAMSVWIRVLGDYDLQLSYRLARIASRKKRADLRTIGTADYEDEIESIKVNNSKEECIELIKAAQNNTFIGEAYANINREELPKMDEISEEPDAPTLEQQEELDRIIAKQEEDYQNKIKEYMADRLLVLESELKLKSDDEIFEMTKIEMSNILALQEFQTELVAQKIFRATYKDEKCRIRAFDNIDDYKNSHLSLKDQLITAYNKLEIAPDDIKN